MAIEMADRIRNRELVENGWHCYSLNMANNDACKYVTDLLYFG